MADKKISDYALKPIPELTDLMLLENAAGFFKHVSLESLHKVKMGLFDYNDLNTQTTPIVVTGGAGFVDLTNDEAGPLTNKSQAPLGVTDIWNKTIGSFDWSELSLGDTIDIRVDLEVITSSVNTAIEVDLFLGTGAGSYSLPFVTEKNFKVVKPNRVAAYNGIYMGDNNTLDNGGKFKISADKNCTVKVNGWYCRIIRR